MSVQASTDPRFGERARVTADPGGHADDSIPYADRRVLDIVFEGLLRKALKKELSPAAKMRLKAIDVDVDGDFKPLYGHPVWVETLRILSQELMPKLTEEQAFRALGARAVIGYFDTLIGLALKQMLRALGVRRSLSRMAQNFSATNNYTRTEARDIGPGHVRLWMNELSETRHNMAGIMEAGLTIAGGKNVSVTIIETDEYGCTYEVRWTP